MFALVIPILCVMGTKYSPGTVGHCSDDTKQLILPFPLCWQNHLCFVSGPAPSRYRFSLSLWSNCLTLSFVSGNCRSVPVGVRQQEPGHAQESGAVPLSLPAGEEQRCWP